MKPCKSIWKNGDLIPWESAQTHVLTHTLHYGSGVFEGIRAYETKNGPAIFRSEEHYQRLFDSAAFYEIPIPFSKEALIAANKALIIDNTLDSCYIRPLAYYGYGTMGLNPGNNPVDVIIAAWEWGTYLGDEGVENGIRCIISKWEKFSSKALPALSKCCANYANSTLAKREALSRGVDEAILLNQNGTVAEGPGENLFLIKDGKISTPPTDDDALKGITRDSLITIAKNQGYSVIERSIAPEELFTADELFFTGTAAEVTPIREIDGKTIGNGSRGSITKELQSIFFDAVKGKNKDYEHWLDYVNN